MIWAGYFSNQWAELEIKLAKKSVYPYHMDLTSVNNCKILIKKVLMEGAITDIEKHAWLAYQFWLFGQHCKCPNLRIWLCFQAPGFTLHPRHTPAAYHGTTYDCHLWRLELSQRGNQHCMDCMNFNQAPSNLHVFAGPFRCCFAMCSGMMQCFCNIIYKFFNTFCFITILIIFIKGSSWHVIFFTFIYNHHHFAFALRTCCVGGAWAYRHTWWARSFPKNCGFNTAKCKVIHSETRKYNIFIWGLEGEPEDR